MTMHPLTTSGGGSKRRKVAGKSARRQPTKEANKKELLPTTASTPVSKKAKNIRRGVTILGFVALFFISLSTVSVWRARAVKRYSSQSLTPKTSNFYSQMQGLSSHHPSTSAHPSPSSPQQILSHIIQDSKDFEPPQYHDSRLGVEPGNILRANERQDLSSYSSFRNKEENFGESREIINTASEKDDGNVNRNPLNTSSTNNYSNTAREEQLREPIQSAKIIQSASGSTRPADPSGINSLPANLDKKGFNDAVQGETNSNSSDSPENGAPIGTKKTNEDPVLFDEPPERIELYTRDDFKEGMRPLCRISHPYILSNGTFLFPKWMEKHSRLLTRCAITRHGFYSSDEPPTFLRQVNSIDADFALTIQIERFQEPTRDESIYFTEHLLKASYLFDMFGGDGRQMEAVKEELCYMYEDNTNCTGKRPPQNALKPAVFVPRQIAEGSRQARSFKLIKMFGIAHGNGHGVIPLNTSSLLMSSHMGLKKDLLGTRFRSVLSTDGMFRHLPVEGLKNGNYFSAKNGVVRAKKPAVQNGKCSLIIGIVKSHDETGVKQAEELKGKLEVLTKFALPEALISVKLLDLVSVPLDEHMKHIHDVDIFLAGSGGDLNSMGFMRDSGMVFELMPFGAQPNTHESLARVLGLGYKRVKSRPQTERFKQCIEAEIVKLRKSGKVAQTEKPDWQEPLMKAWDAAVAEFATTGSSDLDVLSAPSPIRNFYSRVCALSQAIDVNLDDTARQVILASKEKCELK